MIKSEELLRATEPLGFDLKSVIQCGILYLPTASHYRSEKHNGFIFINEFQAIKNSHT
jgi:hypothetical protein